MQKSHIRQLDDIDRHILSILEENARSTYVEIANQVGLSQTPCVERMKRLERDGYIERYTVQLNPRLLDRGFMVFVHVSFSDSTNRTFDRFAKVIERIDEVEECHMVAGDYDCLVKVRAKDMEEFRKVITMKISEIPGIARTNSYAVIEEVKSRSSMARNSAADS